MDTHLSGQWNSHPHVPGLASFEAANGIIMFGWSTAIIIAAVRHVYFDEINKSSQNTESNND
jgi:hypothetical protein